MQKEELAEIGSIISTDAPSTQKVNKKAKKKPKQPMVSMLELFRFSTFQEKCLIFTAVIFSAGSGALQPVSILIYGNFINNITATLSDPSQIVDAVLPVIIIMVIMGSVAMVTAYIANFLWVLTGESQTRRIRGLYLNSVLKQDMSWFDAAEDGSLNTRLASDTQLVQDGISEKFGQVVTLFAQFVAGFTVAFVKGWRMAVVMLAVLPLLVATGIIMARFIVKYTTLAQQSFAEAGSIAEQAFHSIRTVYSYTLQKRFVDRYDVKLEEASVVGVKRGISMGIGFGTFLVLQFFNFSLALWYGSSLVIDGKLTGPEVFVVFLAMMMGSISFLKLPPNLVAVASARGAAFKLFDTIDRVPEINLDAKGLVPDTIHGLIEFKNVTFKYPTRPDLLILKGLNIKIEPGMTVAFVGPSGSGKSTTIQLVQRFYDALTGEVSLDGTNVKDLDVRWLRQQIGVVSQEPVLFNMTIRQNLLMGTHDEVSEKALISACKEANCHTFISQLPNGYDTLVGEQGGMLSGGQKQRIAIARAILKNPTILLLDEATSALDTQSERLVQNALDRASTNRTTIVVAHRLSTIINSDLIVVLDHGEIIEQGTHEELLKNEATYAGLVKKQMIDVNQKGGMNTNLEEDPETLLRQEELEVQKKIEEQQNGLKHVLTKQSTRHSQYTDEKITDINQIDAYDLKIQEATRLKEEMSKQRAPFVKVFFAMRQEWTYLFIGVLGSAIAGCIFPIYAYSFSNVVVILSLPGQEIRPGPLQGTNLYAFIFFILGIAAFIGNCTQFSCYEICGEKFSKRFRTQIFATYLKQEIGFFDQEENNTGALTTKLAVDARNVNEMITKVWGDVTQLTATIILGLALAFTGSWQLTLITLLMAPLLAGATAYEFRVQKGFEDNTKLANAQSGQVAGEAIREVRTVAGLNKQSHFEERYYHATVRPHKLSVRKAYLSSIAAGFSKGINMYTSAIAFYAGARLIANGTIGFPEMFTSMTVIMTTAESAGRSTTFAATFSKAKFAALASFAMIDRQSLIDPELEGIEPKTGSLEGNVEMENIKFTYPARPEIPIFDGQFNFSGKAGTTIALVGPSGCGKSTTIGMLQRWYDPLKGTVSIDGQNVKSFSLYNLRSHMAIVSQEPSLFDLTIGENIRFGIEDGIEISQEEVEAACKTSNIHEFISTLPEGYNTRVGDKGSQLSGGQKQRIAIARALIRKPKVLLLDEATSALDSESERLVQDALDNIIQEGGRTTITIAHRLSTIKDADLICVVKNGTIIEQGTHWELLKLNGTYSDMVNQQSLSVL